MRNLLYKLENGDITTTYAAAVRSGERFTAYLADVPRAKGRISPIRKEMLELYGVVRPHRKER